MKILVVDDIHENRYLLEMMLKGNDLEVVCACNGKEALELLEENEFDIIISDILMPEMDGYQLCREVKSSKKLRNIIFIFYTSTYTDKKDEQFAYGLGADKFIRKPIEPDKFMKILNEVLKFAEQGEMKPQKITLKRDAKVFKTYSERLVNKLEDKMLSLDKVARKYREIFNNAFDAIYLNVVSKEKGVGQFIEVNEPAIQMLGYSAEEFKTMFPFEIESLDSESRIDSLISELFEKKQIVYNQVHKAKNGTEIPVEISSHIFELEGELIVLSIARNIRERLIREKAISQAAENWRRSFNSLMEIMLIINRENVIENINQTGLNVLKMSRGEVIGKEISQYFPNITSIDNNPIRKAFCRGIAFISEYKDEHSNKFYKIKCSPVLNDKLETMKLVILMDDITDQKRSEMKLKEYQINLEKIVKKRTKNLEQKNLKLHHYIKLFENREFRIRELKDELNSLKEKLKE